MYKFIKGWLHVWMCGYRHKQMEGAGTLRGWMSWAPVRSHLAPWQVPDSSPPNFSYAVPEVNISTIACADVNQCSVCWGGTGAGGALHCAVVPSNWCRTSHQPTHQNWSLSPFCSLSPETNNDIRVVIFLARIAVTKSAGCWREV